MSLLEIAAVLFNVAGVWLTARRILWCWPVGIVAVLLYAGIFYQSRLYSDMLLQGLFALMLAYGWRQWWRGADTGGRVAVSRLPGTTAAISLACGLFGGLALGAAMGRFTDAALPWLDALLTGFSLVASFWAARRYPASWLLWIILDLIYVGLFLYKDLRLTAALYAGFVVLAMLGWRAWRRQGIAQAMPPG